MTVRDGGRQGRGRHRFSHHAGERAGSKQRAAPCRQDARPRHAHGHPAARTWPLVLHQCVPEAAENIQRHGGEEHEHKRAAHSERRRPAAGHGWATAGRACAVGLESRDSIQSVSTARAPGKQWSGGLLADCSVRGSHRAALAPGSTMTTLITQGRPAAAPSRPCMAAHTNSAPAALLPRRAGYSMPS